MNYSIIDVETTGSSPTIGKITEIAIYVFNGSEVIDSFTSLVNPECNIPWNITRLTGITNEMVEHAPKFYEIAKKIVELSANTLFVAHNASFDYSFIREEFKRLGYDYKRKTLCTVTLSRKLIPGMRSYSLGSLCEALSIKIENRHRADGDAQATVKLFSLLLNQHRTLESDLFTSRKGSLSEKQLAEIPGCCGVYYFYNLHHDLIYIGKSKNVHQRVLAHLNNQLTKKAMDMSDSIAAVDVSETGSELVALLLESEEIKKHQPFFNRIQKRSADHFGIFLDEDQQGYQHLIVRQMVEHDIPLTTFHFHQEALDYLHSCCLKYKLCRKLCHLEICQDTCFNVSTGGCSGACIGLETAENYNERVKEAIKQWTFASPNFFILEKGKNQEEWAVIKIADGRYMGYGFLHSMDSSDYQELLHDCIQRKKDNWEVRRIITNYLRKNHRRLRIVEY
ncbi:MAG: 3'-5' exoribonuclease [Marinilabiliales bacterium]|nr:3'-5' exoribonuclease [Marinilabiliales bacterium]